MLVECTKSRIGFTVGERYEVLRSKVQTYSNKILYELTDDYGDIQRRFSQYFKNVEEKPMEAELIESLVTKGGITRGNLYRVVSRRQQKVGVYPHVTIVNNFGNEREFPVCYFKKPQKEKPMEKEEWREYSFNIRSKVSMDEYSIEKDLSPSNPMLIVEVEGSKLVLVLLHDSIWTKARNSGKFYEEEYLCPIQGSNCTYKECEYDGRLHKFLSQDGWIRKDMFLTPLVKLVKEIQAAAWHKPYRAKVTVRKISI